MNGQPDAILAVGVIFFLGLASDLLGRSTVIPRVTFLILIGVVTGPSALDIIPDALIVRFADVTTIALGMVGFLLGQKFTPGALAQTGRRVLLIAAGKVLVAFGLVAAALVLGGVPFSAALILAAIAAATAPAAVYEVVHEMGIDTDFSRTLLAVVALDDVLALLLFSIVLAVAGSASGALLQGGIEVFGSLALGFCVGYPIAMLTGRISKGEPMMIEALGSIFLISGLAQLLGLSTILGAMAMGSAVSLFATHHTRPFHAIENVQWPFMVLFFLLAGASLELETWALLKTVGLYYVAARLIGFYVGARIGAVLARAPRTVVRWMGPALIPQAGVAVGMALIASQRFEAHATLLLQLILATTVIFEIIGPVVTRYALRRALEETSTDSASSDLTR